MFMQDKKLVANFSIILKGEGLMMSTDEELSTKGGGFDDVH